MIFLSTKSHLLMDINTLWRAFLQGRDRRTAESPPHPPACAAACAGRPGRLLGKDSHLPRKSTLRCLNIKRSGAHGLVVSTLQMEGLIATRKQQERGCGGSRFTGVSEAWCRQPLRASQSAEPGRQAAAHGSEGAALLQTLPAGDPCPLLSFDQTWGNKMRETWISRKKSNRILKWKLFLNSVLSQMHKKHARHAPSQLWLSPFNSWPPLYDHIWASFFNGYAWFSQEATIRAFLNSNVD